MNLLKIFETGIVSNILPSDVFAVLMLITTSKTVKNKILDIHPKVDVDLTNKLTLTSHSKKKCDILLSIESFSKIIQKLSSMFIIDTLNLQDFKIQRSIITEYPNYILFSYKNNKMKGYTYKITYFHVITAYCKSLSNLLVTCYSDENILVREFIKNMPNCKVSHFHKEYGKFGCSPGDHNCFYYNGLKYYDTNICIDYIAPEKLTDILLENIERFDLNALKLDLNAL
jgi:uncharacterized protein Veg